MPLDHLNSFFLRFKNITPPNETIRKCVCDFILKKIGIEVSFKDISVRNEIVYINTKPAVKNEVFMRKKELLDFIEEKTTKILKDVR